MSDFLMETFYKNHSIRPQHLIADGIDAPLFAPVIPVRDIDILGAGNLVPLKRYHIFINVVSVLAATGVVQKATLCGSGTEEHLLKQQVAGAGLQNIVEFTGLIPHAGVLQYMQRAKVFLHTSEYEGFGNVCIEALYAGAHVISFTRPMRQHIPHWHIVSTVGEMIEKAMDLLQQPATVYSPVLPFDMNDSAKQFIQLLAGDNI
jgi:glycosyltransferase involved in cell wall biosynthesis